MTLSDVVQKKSRALQVWEEEVAHEKSAALKKWEDAVAAAEEAFSVTGSFTAYDDARRKANANLQRSVEGGG